MAEFKVTTKETVLHEYLVVADTREEAVETFGETDSVEVDWLDTEVYGVELLSGEEVTIDTEDEKLYDGVNQTRAFTFYNNLRDSGVTNMFGAPPFMEKEMGVTKAAAMEAWTDWIASFK